MFAETDRISPHLRQKLLLFYLKLHLEQTHNGYRYITFRSF